MRFSRGKVVLSFDWLGSIAAVIIAVGSAACDTAPENRTAPADTLAPGRQPSGTMAAKLATAATRPAASAASQGPTDTVKLGAPIRSTNDVALANIARDATKYAQQTVKTEGRVTSVCQAMGCWMEITDSDSHAHIRMTGHSFFIPKEAIGRRARLEGTVLAKPDDGACEQEAREATGRTVKVEIDATGVELL